MAHHPIRRRNNKKSKQRLKPYSRNTGDIDVDMKLLDMDAVESGGKMKQRHKREQRQLRERIAAITIELKRLSKRKAGEKDERREKTRLIRQLTEALNKRHAEEIASLESERTCVDLPDTTKSSEVRNLESDFTFNLPSLVQSSNEMIVE